MKPIKYIAIFGFILINKALTLRVLPTTPKASDLSDHFGTEPGNNVFGPKTAQVQRLMREGITSEATPVTPIGNFGKEINPTQVVAGELDNTAFDASKIVKPEYASK
jgi:hypothetical protein